MNRRHRFSGTRPPDASVGRGSSAMLCSSTDHPPNTGDKLRASNTLSARQLLRNELSREYFAQAFARSPATGEW
jgi:hypothetical protein